MSSFKYKDGYIHINFTNSKEEIITVNYKYICYHVKSIHAAKLKISKLMKSGA